MAVSSRSPQGDLSSQQAHEAAHRLVARYYDYERIAPILRLLEAISWRDDGPDRGDGEWALRAIWQTCVQETLDGAPLPPLPPPWDS